MTLLLAILKPACPLILAGLIQSSVCFFETLFLSRLGTDVMAAGALVSWSFSTMMVAVSGTLSAISVLVSQKRGAQDEQGIAVVWRDGAYLSLILAALCILFLFCLPMLFTLTGQSLPILCLAKDYLDVLVWGIPPGIILVVSLELIIGMGQPLEIAISNALFPVFAILSSYALIFGKLGCHSLGIAGAGWGIVLANWGTAILLGMYMVFGKKYRKYFGFAFFFQKPRYLLEIARIGFPSGLMYCSEVAFFLVVALFMGSMGNEIVAAHQIVMQYAGVFFSVIFALSLAITVQMGCLIGADDRKGARMTGQIGWLVSVICMFLVAIIFWLVPERLVSIDLDMNQPNHLLIVQHVRHYFFICAIFEIFEGARIACFAILRANRDTRFALIVSAVSFWSIALPVGYGLSERIFSNGDGMWWGMVVGAAFASGIMMYRVRSFQLLE